MSHQGLVSARTIAPLAAVLFGLLLLAPVSASAAEQVGRVLVAVGGVTATQDDASARGLGRGDPLYTGDTIRTGARGRVQMRFQDGAMVDLEPGSRFEVNEYSGGDGGGSVVMSFLRGAMRTITGAIGIDSGESYRMNTTVATIGVRGTAYALHYCDADCVDAGGQPGLYGRVDEGEISVDGPFGSFAFSSGQYFFIPENGEPRRIVVPPEGILGGGDEAGAGGDDDRIEDVEIRPLDSGYVEGLDLGDRETDLLDPNFESAEGGRIGKTANALFAGAYVGSSGFTAYESPGGGDVRIDERGGVIGAQFGSEFIEVGSLDTFESDSAQIATADGPLDLTWGSWSGEGGPREEGDLAGFAYTLTDPSNITTPSQLASLQVSVSFFDIGGPSAVDSDGGVWSVDTLSVGVDFSQGIINDAQIQVSNDFTFILVGDSSLDVAFNADGSFSVGGLQQIEGASYTGSIEGRFVGIDANGALVAFELREIDGVQRIVGSRILEQGGT